VTDILDAPLITDVPADIGAERAVLGAIIQSEQAAAEVAGLVSVDEFSEQHHQIIYARVLDMLRRGDPIDPHTVRAALDERGEFTGAFQPPYLIELMRACPVIANATAYARRVARVAARRRTAEQLRIALADLTAGADLTAVAERVSAALDAEARLARSESAHEWADRMTGGGGFILDVPDSPPAIWGDGDQVAWAEGEALMIVGPPGVGKTTLVGQLVAARMGIGDGRVLGLPVRPGTGRVLYLAMDRPPQIARALGRLFGPQDRAALDERLVVWKGPPPQDFARQPDLLAAMCEQAGADTVIVDSLKDCVRKLSDDEAGGGYNTARQQALVAGVQVVELHHQRKAGGENKKPSKLDDVYGSVWLTAGAGSVILLWGEPGDPVVELLHLKQPAEPLGPWQICHDHTTGRSEIRHQVDLLQLAQTWKPSGTVGLTARAAACALFSTDKPTPSQVEKARRRLEKLRGDGLLDRRKAPDGSAVYFRTAPEREV